MSVRRTQQEVSSREFAEWLAYHRIEPWGPVRGDLRAAMVAKTVADVHRGKDQEPYPISDFLLRFGAEARGRTRQSAKTLLGKAEALNRMLGGRDLRGQD